MSDPQKPANPSKPTQPDKGNNNIPPLRVNQPARQPSDATKPIPPVAKTIKNPSDRTN
jgi:hypothetical protein